MKRPLHADPSHKDSRTSNDLPQQPNLDEQTVQEYQDASTGAWSVSVNAHESYEGGADGIDGRVLRKMKRIKLDSE